MPEPTYKSVGRTSALLSILYSPCILLSLLFMTSIFVLTLTQNQAGLKLQTLVEAVGELEETQTRLLESHEHLIHAVGDLRTDAKRGKGKLISVYNFTRERNVIVNGIPEENGENIEEVVRELFNKKLGLTFDDLVIEEVKRFGQKSSYIQSDGRNIMAAPVKVRFFSYRDKLSVLKMAKELLSSVTDDVLEW